MSSGYVLQPCGDVICTRCDGVVHSSPDSTPLDEVLLASAVHRCPHETRKEQRATALREVPDPATTCPPAEHEYGWASDDAVYCECGIQLCGKRNLNGEGVYFCVRPYWTHDGLGHLFAGVAPEEL